MLILGIETSCDETSAAVVEAPDASVGLGKSQPNLIIRSNVIASQTDLHSRFGGVVPEIASRRHVEAILPTIQEALDVAGTNLDSIDCVAVINRPGLIGALIVGVAAAKSIAYTHGIPLVPVHHLEAHIYANWLSSTTQKQPFSEIAETRIQFPAVCLVVSGGHSDLLIMIDHGHYHMVGRTVDDAAGEAFDKCARAMGLGYPGGPIIDKLAREGNPEAIPFPRGKVGDSLNFSFSGLKTAVIRYLEAHRGEVHLPDVAASFQEAVVDVLVDHTIQAATNPPCTITPHRIRQILLAGGVAANSRLKSVMKQKATEQGLEVIIPPPILCTDNAAMAAAAGYFRFCRGETAGIDLDCYATEPLEEAGATRSSV